MDSTTRHSPPFFSIIIPCYNYGNYLPRAIESVLAQTCDDYELIVIDDGSTDDTPAVVSSYRDKIIYHRQINAGQCAAHNKGVSLARGQYCYFLDADDELLVDALDNFRSAFWQFGEVPLFFGGYITVRENGDEITRSGSTIAAEAFAALQAFLRKELVGVKHGSVIIHHRVFEVLRYPPDVRNNTDIVFLGQVLSRYRAVGIVTPVFRSHAHTRRARKNHVVAAAAGLSVVNVLFDARYVPAHLMILKKTFRERRQLSLSRTLYKAKDFPGSRFYYCQAVRSSPALLLKMGYLKRFILSMLRGPFKFTGYAELANGTQHLLPGSPVSVQRCQYPAKVSEEQQPTP
jgi:glycosyltransferase involved in cell wall biosynthesis